MTSLSAIASVSDGTDHRDLLNRAIEAYYADINAAVRRRGHSDNDASEIVHDLYLKLSAQPETLLRKRSIRAFLCRAAINLGIDRFRRERFEVNLFSGSVEEAQEIAGDNASPDRGLSIKGRLAVLREAIAELPDRRRAVFILHRVHHLTPDQIATKLGISRNMVDRHLRRALGHCLDRLLELE